MVAWVRIHFETILTIENLKECGMFERGSARWEAQHSHKLTPSAFTTNSGSNTCPLLAWLCTHLSESSSILLASSKQTTSHQVWQMQHHPRRMVYVWLVPCVYDWLLVQIVFSETPRLHLHLTPIHRYNSNPSKEERGVWNHQRTSQSTLMLELLLLTSIHPKQQTFWFVWASGAYPKGVLLFVPMVAILVQKTINFSSVVELLASWALCPCMGLGAIPF